MDIISKGEIATLRRRENLINSDRATDAKIDIQYERYAYVKVFGRFTIIILQISIRSCKTINRIIISEI